MLRRIRQSLAYLLVGALTTALLPDTLSAQLRDRLRNRPRRISPGLERFRKMTPEERQRALDRLPPERKKILEERLNKFNQLSPDERKRLAEKYDEFQQLPPEQQEHYRQIFRRFREMPEERRSVLRDEAVALRDLPEPERRNRMQSEEFKKKYSEKERKLLEDLAGAVPPE